MVESGKKYPYPCIWGCGRAEVVSVEENSCGRANCNLAWRAVNVPSAITDVDRLARGAVKTISEQVSQDKSAFGEYGPKKNK